MHSLTNQVAESTSYLNQEPETESFWLYRYQTVSTTRGTDGGERGAKRQDFDFPLPGNKRILKLMY